MSTEPNINKTSRIHSLDALRAIMMMLGLVLHTAFTYTAVDHGQTWPLKDPEASHYIYDYLVEFIHLFRMPTFFWIAGFFGAMLFYERQALNMIRNRISRILLPFIVFLFLLWPFISFSFGYTMRVFEGETDVLSTMISWFSDTSAYRPRSTSHLWFLYYLVMITACSICIGFLLKKLPGISQLIKKGFNWIIQKPILRILLFSALTVLVYLFMGTTKVKSALSFLPNENTFIFYFFFYQTGWVLYKSRHLLNDLKRTDWLCTLLGFGLFAVYFFNTNFFDHKMHPVIRSFALWLTIFGITGLFIRYFSQHSPLMRYISDASYWVYLIHLPLTVLLPGLIADWPLPVHIKFLIVLSTSALIAFSTYHYFVRSTFIGQFLNGRKYSRKLSDIKLNTILSK